MGLRTLFLSSMFVAALPLAASATLSPTNPPVPFGGQHGLAILRPCRSSQLKAAVTSDQGAMLHRELSITLTNVGAGACAIDGTREVDGEIHERRPQEEAAEDVGGIVQFQ